MWLLESEALKQLEVAHNTAMRPTDEQQKSFVALHSNGAANGQQSRLLSINNNHATIDISGVMTRKPDIMAMFFGGGNVTYPEIIDALKLADANESAKAITLNIDSPGGEFDGLFDVLAAIQTTSKPINTFGTGIIASGAYAIAAQTDSIEVSNVSARVGSIGVAMSIYVSDDIVNLASTNAPNKRPDVRTPQGKAIVQEELDAMHDIFAESIASGRNTSTENVNANFGRGGTVLAVEAVKRGMIDSVAEMPRTNQNANTLETSKTPTQSNKPEKKAMDISTLKTQHPEVFEAAQKSGVEQERDRVVAHLTMGENTGDMKTASAAIKDGSLMTQTLQATYLTAGLNRRDTEDRQGDNVETTSTTDDTKENDISNSVVSMVETLAGCEVDAA